MLDVVRRADGPVSFDLQILSDNAILTLPNGEPAEVRVPGTQLEPGEHEVDLTLAMRIPYILIGGGQVLQIAERCTKRMAA